MNAKAQSTKSNKKKWALWGLISLGIALIIIPLFWCHFIHMVQLLMGIGIISQVKNYKDKDKKHAGYILGGALIIAGIAIPLYGLLFN